MDQIYGIFWRLYTSLQFRFQLVSVSGKHLTPPTRNKFSLVQWFYFYFILFYSFKHIQYMKSGKSKKSKNVVLLYQFIIFVYAWVASKLPGNCTRKATLLLVFSVHHGDEFSMLRCLCCSL